MKKLLFAICLSIAGPAFAQDNFKNDFQRINDEVQNHYEGYSNLKYATETIGHRLVGSPNGAKAEQLAFDILTKYGYHPRFQSFEVESWMRKTVSLTIGGEAVKVVTLAHSPVKSDVTAQLIDVGNGMEADYTAKGNAVKGKIALIYLGVLPGSPAGTPSLHRSEKTAIATSHGAIGVIIINTVKNGVLLTGTASVTGKLIPIPAVCIGLETGMALKEKMMTTPQSATIKMTNFSGMIKARNIIATIKGTQFPKEIIVTGGHLDSWDLATGAIDNGIGSFSVLDMARTFAKLQLKPKRTVEFVMFMGEEVGLLGSKAYVDAAKKDGTLANVRFMLNYDMTNDPRGFSTTRIEMKPQFVNWGDQIKSFNTDYPNAFQAGAGLHSDHEPFMLEGIPTGGGAGGRLPNNAGQFYHSDGDVFSLVDEQGMKNTTKNGAWLTYALAQTSTLPVEKQSDEKLKQFLIDQNLQLPLTIAGEWRWGKE